MKHNQYSFIYFKLIVCIVLTYIFFYSDILTVNGYNLSVDGIVICRGLAILYIANLIINIADKLINHHCEK